MTTETDNLELDEAYDSAEDEDFELDAAGQDESEISSSEGEGEGEESSAQPVKKKRKTGPRGKKARDKDADKDEDAELDSGDEVTIQKAKAKGKADDEDSDEGGTGGFVRTRAMKMRTQEERKPLAKVDGATVDVNALWEKMNASEGMVPLPTQTETEPAAEEKDKTAEPEKPPTPERKQVKFTEEMIKIKRTYKFAGEMITEEKTVPKDSAEAKIYLSGENADADAAAHDADTVKLRRPLRKVSRFDPNPTGTIKKSWEKQPVETAKGPKINTVEKSRLDWAQYVDQAGIKDELAVHSKAKEGYMGRMDFLGRVDANREEERRNARLRGM